MKQCSRDQQHTVRLTLNGAARSAACEPRMLLSDFLREGLGATGTHVGCEHGVCGANTGMASERHFAARTKHADAIAGVLGIGREYERGFRQAGPACNRLHRGIVQALRIQHHGQWIARTGARGEDIKLYVTTGHGRCTCGVGLRGRRQLTNPVAPG